MTEQRTLTVGNIALSFHRATAAVVRRILEAHGHTVRTIEAPHEEMFARQAAGRADVLVSAWLPDSHDTYLNPYRDQVRVLSPTYSPYCVWAVPPYIPENVVGEVADLARPEVAARMKRAIGGINPGAGISRFSARMIGEYGLDELGYSFTPGTESGFIDQVERGIAEGKWFVIPLWRPQYLNRRHGLRALAEPKGLLGNVDAASTVIRLDALARVEPRAVAALDALRLGNEGVEEIDELINVDGLTPLAAADRFLRDHAGLLTG